MISAKLGMSNPGERADDDGPRGGRGDGGGAGRRGQGARILLHESLPSAAAAFGHHLRNT